MEVVMQGAIVLGVLNFVLQSEAWGDSWSDTATIGESMLFINLV